VAAVAALVEQTQGDEFDQSALHPGKTFSAINMDVNVTLAVAGLGAHPIPRIGDFDVKDRS
jgi:hypothetical protein